MTPRAPRVSIVLAAYNAAPYLAEALASFQAQTFGDFEVIAIDDGSTDETPQVLAAGAARDPRMRVRRQSNAGVGAARNAALDLVRGAYLAVADADDVSLPQRLAAQVEYLEAHPEVGVLGGALEVLGRPTVQGARYAPDDATIRAHLVFGSPLGHPAAMLRRELFTDRGLRYRPDLRITHDYQLWIDAASWTRFANLDRPLIQYREHPGQLTGPARREALRRELRQIWTALFAALGVPPTDADLAGHTRLALWEPFPDLDELARAADWLARLEAANAVARVFPVDALARQTADRWYRACALSAGLGPRVFGLYRRRARVRPWPRLARLALRCWLRR